MQSSNPFAGKSLISVSQLTTQSILYLFDRASRTEADFKSNHPRLTRRLSGRVMATLFFEPSTRTRLSFETGVLRMGGSIINSVGNTSSLEKGESLEDTGRVVSCFADLIVMRHPESLSVGKLASTATVPVINAGDGSNEHPTQALLDLFTIWKHHPQLEELNVGFVGDLKFGRAALSLIEVLKLFKAKFFFIAHPDLAVPEAKIKLLETAGVQIRHATSLEAVIGDLDVVYMTRVQRERFANTEDYTRLRNLYRMDRDTLKYAKKDLAILHPLPRLDELAPEIDQDPRALYFEQVANGVIVRMALVTAILDH